MERTAERLVVAGTPARCFAVVSDVEAYPQWVARSEGRGRPRAETHKVSRIGRPVSCRGIRAQHELRACV